MKRKIEVRAAGITIIATIRTDPTRLTRGEVEIVRDALADRLQAACANLPFGEGCAYNRVRVR